MGIKEKVAYIKGLMEGMKFDTAGDTGTLLKAIVDALDAIASEVDDISEDLGNLNEYADEIDRDLGDLEEFVYDEDYDDDDDDECDCGCCDDDDDECDEDEDEDEEFDQTVCPECGDTVCRDSSLKNKEINCPGCDAKIKPDKK